VSRRRRSVGLGRKGFGDLFLDVLDLDPVADLPAGDSVPAALTHILGDCLLVGRFIFLRGVARVVVLLLLLAARGRAAGVGARVAWRSAGRGRALRVASVRELLGRSR
jgi:hypothetical protein